MEAVSAIPTAEARRVDILLADDIMTRAIAESEALPYPLCNAFFETWLEGGLQRRLGLCDSELLA